MHECPHPTCHQQIAAAQYGCRYHWFTLPKPVRDAIWAAWRQIRAGERAGIVAHRNATAAAVHFWDEQAKAALP